MRSESLSWRMAGHKDVQVRFESLSWRMARNVVLSLLLCVLLQINAEKSNAECYNKSGQVFYDSNTKTCVCDRSKGFSKRGPPWPFEEQCIKLDISCLPGMELTKNETHCVPCKPGWYKSVGGIDWCTSWTVCKETEWTVFPGNATTDRTCSANEPEDHRNITISYQNESLSSSRMKPQNVSSSQDVIYGGTVAVPTRPAVTDPMKESKYSGGTISSDLFYVICAVSGGILFLAVFCREMKAKCVSLVGCGCNASQDNRDEGEGRTIADTKEEKIVDKRPLQTYVHQVKGDNSSEHQKLLPDDEEADRSSDTNTLLNEQYSNLTIENETKPKTINSESSLSVSPLHFTSLLNDKK